MFDQLQFLLMLKFRKLLRLTCPLTYLWYIIFDMSYQASSLFGIRCSDLFYTFPAPDRKSAISLRSSRDHNLGSSSIYFYEIVHYFWALLVNKCLFFFLEKNSLCSHTDIFSSNLGIQSFTFWFYSCISFLFAKKSRSLLLEYFNSSRIFTDNSVIKDNLRFKIFFFFFCCFWFLVFVFPEVIAQ